MAETGQTQLIDYAGEFNTTGVEAFAAETGLLSWGQEYKMIAIMGPQSSGKSTLLNHLFGTKFREMNALAGRGQTTQGIWMGLATKIDNPVVVLDLEGNDGRERGEDDTAFEKQAALFALSVADVVLVNIWCHDIGREHGAGKPLFKTVMEVQMKLFSPRKTVLLFVIRDRSKTPLDHLAGILTEDMEKIWAGIIKPAALAEKQLQDFFELKFTSLPNFEEKEDLFKAETVMLRERFAADRTEPDAFITGSAGGVPSDGLSFSMQSIWEVVRDNKDLDLPAHKVMVATVRCEQIAGDVIGDVELSDQWEALCQRSKEGYVAAFGAAITAILTKAVDKYDVDTSLFDQKVRDEKREEMRAKLLGMILPLFSEQLAWASAAALESFGESFGTRDAAAPFAACARECLAAALRAFDDCTAEALPSDAGWEEAAATVREQLEADIDGLVASKRNEVVDSTLARITKALETSFTPALVDILDEAKPDMWAAVRQAREQSTQRQQAAMLSAVADLELDAARLEALATSLDGSAAKLLATKLDEAVHSVVMRMRERFSKVFNTNDRGLPRTWDTRVDIGAVSAKAKLAAAQLLSLLAVRRLDGAGEDSYEAVTEVVCQLASPPGKEGEGSGLQRSLTMMPDDLFPAVPEASTLIRPSKCKELWRQFEQDATVPITQAVAAQDAAMRAAASGPPLWALGAIAILGYNEFMAVLYNPFLLLLLLVCVTVGKSLYEKTDVGEAMKHGFLPGLLLLAPKVIPAVQEYVGEVVARVADAHKEAAANAAATAGSSGGSSSSSGATAGTKKPQNVATEKSATAAATSVSGDGLKKRQAAS